MLGSSAASRKAVLLAAGVSFAVLRPDIDEKAHRHEDPYTLPLVVARAKAEACLDKARDIYPDNGCLLITADQVVLGPDNGVREKPESDSEARAFLCSYAGASARTVSAVRVTSTKTGEAAEAVHVAEAAISCNLKDEIEAILQPQKPVPLPELFSKVVNDSTACLDDGLKYGSRSEHGRQSTSSTGTIVSNQTVDIRDCAGGLCIEHPSVAPHVVSIRGLTPSPYSIGIDSLHGLPWAVTRTLIETVCPGHPLGLKKQ